jgi:hypothetical protein
MLVNRGLAIGEIVTIRTTAGEEIIGRLEVEDEKFITLGKPHALVATQKGATLAPVIFTVDVETIPFAKHSVMIGPLPSGKDASDLYIQKSTGIALG